MRKAVIIVCLLLSTCKSFCQENKEMNFILMINEKLASGSIANPRILTTMGEEIGIVYYPGKIMFDINEYNLLLSSEDSLLLAFDYQDFSEEDQSLSNFTLPFSKTWLNQSFTIMRVYHLEKKKYKGVFEPLDEKRNYTFELEYPGGQIMRLRNNN